ncbi:MAG: flavodoxin, partial [Eubacteriales bacterium]|nr:flavodoxin [Eubacteriales bacterium]
MKIGIIVHSFTGNTLLVAQKISEALTQAGHTVALERVTVKDENPNAANAIALAAAPAAAGYDLVLFGAPVRAFSLSPG